MLPGLLALFVASFAFGTTEFIIAGLVPNIATDLGVGIADAGLLISIYALGVALGAPFLSIPTARLERKTALLLLIGLFVVGKIFCAIAPNYPTLMAARLVVAFSQASFFGVANVIVVLNAQPGREGRALAFLWSGVAMSNIFGVPVGTAIGQAFGWRASFLAVGAVGLVAMIGIALLIPRTRALAEAARPSLASQLAVFRRQQVWLSCALICFWMVGFWSMFTFIVPILFHGGATESSVPTAFLIFGIGSTIGSLVSGRLADWNIGWTLVLGIGLAGCAQLGIALNAHSASIVVAMLFLGGTAGFAATSAITNRILRGAMDAPNLASTSAPAMFNIGIAIGSWLGATLISAGIGVEQLPWISVAGHAIAAGIGVVIVMLDRGARVSRTAGT